MSAVAPFNLRSLAAAVEGSLLSESLYEFVKAAWHVCEPSARFVDNWHIRVICEHLEAVSDGRILRLIVNIPPRSMKSTIISVMWPAWDWTRNPSRKWLFASYGQDLATRDAIATRRLIASPWFQARWGHVFELTSDQNQKTRYDNSKLGYRLSTSVGGRATGEGGDIIVADDPHNVREAESDAVRKGTCAWWFESMSTRGNDPERAARVIVMQRVHEEDLTAECLKRGGYEHLCLPMEFERKHPTLSSTSLGFKDPRTKEGELLWPARYTPAALKKLKIDLGEYGAAGQLQQRPSPRGGGLFKEEHVMLWPHDEELPDYEYIVQSYDTAYTEDTANDPVACTVWGIFRQKNVPYAMLLDAWDDHLNYPQLRKKVVADWKARYGGRRGQPMHPARRASAVLVEDKGSGISLLQDLRLARVPVVSYNPGKADKYARAQNILPLYELDMFYVIESSKEPGQAISWARPFLKQLSGFGANTTAHDDYVDTFTQVARHLRDAGFLELPSVEEDEVEKDYSKRRGNPYSQ